MKTLEKPFKISSNAVVAIENSIIDQMNKYSLQELRLIDYCVACYCNSEKFKDKFMVRVTDYIEMYPALDQAHAYTIVKKTLHGLGRKILELVGGNKTTWFSEYTYHDNTGEFEFKFSPAIQPYLQKQL